MHATVRLMSKVEFMFIQSVNGVVSLSNYTPLAKNKILFYAQYTLNHTGAKPNFLSRNYQEFDV